MTTTGESIRRAANGGLDEPADSHISRPPDRGVATPRLMVILLLRDSLDVSVADLVNGLAALCRTGIKRSLLP